MILRRSKRSSPYIVVGIDNLITHRAASGSCQTLNSVACPPLVEPAHKMICATRATTSGCVRNNIATPSVRGLPDSPAEAAHDHLVHQLDGRQRRLPPQGFGQW